MQPRNQRGVALFVAIIFVLMSMLLALWSSRTSLFNEMVVGNDADYQRAFEAAQIIAARCRNGYSQPVKLMTATKP